MFAALSWLSFKTLCLFEISTSVQKVSNTSFPMFSLSQMALQFRQ